MVDSLGVVVMSVTSFGVVEDALSVGVLDSRVVKYVGVFVGALEVLVINVDVSSDAVCVEDDDSSVASGEQPASSVLSQTCVVGLKCRPAGHCRQMATLLTQ